MQNTAQCVQHNAHCTAVARVQNKQYCSSSCATTTCAQYCVQLCTCNWQYKNVRCTYVKRNSKSAYVYITVNSNECNTVYITNKRVYCDGLHVANISKRTKNYFIVNAINKHCTVAQNSKRIKNTQLAIKRFAAYVLKTFYYSN